MQSEHHNDRAIQRSKIDPVIFVPGSSASVNRFDDLFATINAKERGKNVHSVLKVLVKEDGTLSYSGHLSSENRRPFIVVGFERNQDNYPTIKADGESLSKVMTSLQKKYYFRNFSAVGHSNGGLIWTHYLENYYNSTNFHIKTLMTLGSPFNFSETSTTKRTTMLTDMINNSDNLPSDLVVYSVAGSEDYTDDGIVPVQSVLSGKYVFQKSVAKYTQTTVSGENAQHSNLPENPDVVNLINELILNNSRDKRPTLDRSQQSSTGNN
nr:alpha/beta hydrolase [Fructobacillus ficulneus]